MTVMQQALQTKPCLENQLCTGDILGCRNSVDKHKMCPSRSSEFHILITPQSTGGWMTLDLLDSFYFAFVLANVRQKYINTPSTTMTDDSC